MNYFNKEKILFYFSTNRSFFIIFCVCLLFLQTFSSKLRADYFDQVTFWTSECVRSRNVDSCKTALMIADDFQLYASSKDQHRCQTSLLALEANLIMIILNSPKRTTNLKALDMVKNTCREAEAASSIIRF